MTKNSRTVKATNLPKPKAPAGPKKKPALSQPTTKLDRLASLLSRRNGATIADLIAVTGWQSHSVRGALAGALKRRGLVITSEKIDGVRRYRSGGAR